MTVDVLLAGEFTRDPDREIADALRSLDAGCGRLTVALVAIPQRVLGYGLPFCGVALIEQVRKDTLCEAQRRACRIASMAPGDLRVEHLVVAGWAELLRHAACGRYDAVLVAEPPSRLLDRLLVRGTPKVSTSLLRPSVR
jgi:hypothetical protein